MTIDKAIALLYPNEAEAPIITAKTSGYAAKKMLELAEKFDVKILKDEPLVDVLTLYEVGECVPEETYEVLAKVFAFIRRIYDEHAKN